MTLPISASFDPGPEESDGEWINDYVVNTFEYAVVLLPLISAFLLIPKLKKTLRRILIILSLILSGITSYAAFQLLALPIQDFIPQYGMGLLLFLFPVTLINSLIEWKEKPQQ